MGLNEEKTVQPGTAALAAPGFFAHVRQALLITWKQGTLNIRKELKMEACNLPLAIATVPLQKFEKLYPLPLALTRGTLFCALDLPFQGGRA